MMVQGNNNSVQIGGDLILFQPILTKAAIKLLEKNNHELRFSCDEEESSAPKVTVSIKKVSPMSSFNNEMNRALTKKKPSKIAA